MNQKKFKKSSVIGIISIFIITSIAPSIINADPATDIGVQLIKWDGTQIIEEIQYMPLSAINTFQDELESCTSLEQGYTVFQDYGITPQDKTYEDLLVWANNEYEENQEIMQEYIENYYPIPYELFFEGYSVIDWGKVNAPFDCYKTIFSNYFLSTITYTGGHISYISTIPLESDYWENSGYFDVFRLVWIGAYWPPVHNGRNIMPRDFACWTLSVSYSMYIGL